MDGVAIGGVGFTLTLIQVSKTRGDVQRALGRFRRVATTADIGTSIKMIDEIGDLLQRDAFEPARMRAGDLRVLLPQIQELAPDEDSAYLQPMAALIRLVHDLLGDVVDGDRSRYEGANVRRSLSEIRAAMENLQAQSRAAGGQ